MRFLAILLSLFAFCTHADPAPMIDCYGTGSALESHRNPPTWSCATQVSSFSGDGTLISNSGSTGAVTATLANAGSYSVWGNNTGSSAAPGYQTSFHVSGTGEIDGYLGIGEASSSGIPLAVNLGTTGVVEYNGTSGLPPSFVFAPYGNYFNSNNVYFNGGGFTCAMSGSGAAAVQITTTTGNPPSGIILQLAPICTGGGAVTFTSELSATPSGITLESPTGGFEGGGTLNASALYQNGVQDYNAVGTGITASGPTISCATASSSTVGCVKVDNTTITAASGVISSVNTGTVTTTGTHTTGNLAIFSGASSITNATIGTGLTISSSTLNSNAEQTISFQPGLLSAVTGTKGVYGKFVKASTVDNIEASAITFTCVGNPTITLYECGTSSTCASSPVTIGSATVTTSGQVFDGTIASAAITAGDYVAWAISAGTCTSLDIAATAQIHSN